MGKIVENPRYHVLSIRVSDEEMSVISEAKRAGLNQESLRNLVMFGARCLSADPPIPIERVTCATASPPWA